MARPQLALNPNAKTEKTMPYVRPRVKQDRAAYGISDSHGFFDDKDKFWGLGEALYFDGEPSLAMVPLNKMGHDRLSVLYKKLNALGVVNAEMKKTSYTPMVLREWTEDDDNEDFKAPDSVMGVKKEGENQAIR